MAWGAILKFLGENLLKEGGKQALAGAGKQALAEGGKQTLVGAGKGALKAGSSAGLGSMGGLGYSGESMVDRLMNNAKSAGKAATGEMAKNTTPGEFLSSKVGLDAPKEVKTWGDLAKKYGRKQLSGTIDAGLSGAGMPQIRSGLNSPQARAGRSGGQSEYERRYGRGRRY